jgi:hypothetical protein
VRGRRVAFSPSRLVAGYGAAWAADYEHPLIVRISPGRLDGEIAAVFAEDDHPSAGRGPRHLGDDLPRSDAGTGGPERLGRRRRSPQIALDDGKLWPSSLLSDDAAGGGDPASGLECLDLDGRGQFHIESRVRLVRWRLGQVSFSSVDLRPRTPPPGQRGVPAGAGGAA